MEMAELDFYKILTPKDNEGRRRAITIHALSLDSAKRMVAKAEGYPESTPVYAWRWVDNTWTQVEVSLKGI